MSDDAKRPGLWGKLARGLFEFDAPLTADLLPLLPTTVSRGRGEQRPPLPGAPARGVAPVETLDIDMRDTPDDLDVRERVALVVVHGHAPGERFDVEPGTASLGPHDDALLICDDDGVTLRAQGPDADIHVDFRRVREARLEHGVLVGIGGTLLKFLRCRDLEGAHFDEVYRLHRHDGLTDVHHERHLRYRLWSELSRARRHANSLALVVLDLDLRTARGAALTGTARDRVLREVAGAVRRVIGDKEILGRHGPGQLALVLPGLDLAAATPRAEAIRAAAASIAIDGVRVAPAPSIGIAVLERDMLIHDDLLRAALAALPARA